MSSVTDKRYLVVIPARGGSKRLPGKNLMKIAEHSLIGRAILCAKNAGLSGDICITTDDQAIADEVVNYGPYIHFMRPESLATDGAKTVDVILHAIQWFAERDRFYDAVIILQPTSPLRTEKHLKDAVALFEARGAEAVVSVCQLEHPVEWCAELGPQGSMEKFGETLNTQKRSQDLAQRYRLNGAIYIYDIKALSMATVFFYNDKTYAYEMDIPSSTDVDTHHDYMLATFWHSLSRH